MKELFKLISDKYAKVIESRLCLDRLCELRVRNGLPVRVWYNGTYFYLGENGITKEAREAFIAGDGEAEEIILRACDRSLYTVTETLKRGYIPVGGGIRIGVCGSVVLSGDAVSAVKDFTSVNIRIPHAVNGCASTLIPKIAGSSVKNTLIISSPGGGKTTVVRDLTRLISNKGFNVMLCDEKCEIASCYHGAPTLDVGQNTDVVSGLDKNTAFRIGIAFMRPDVIVTDELFDSDIDGLLRAVNSGISVICTAHAKDFSDLKRKRGYDKVLSSRVFERIAVISTPRRDITVFDGDGNEF